MQRTRVNSSDLEAVGYDRELKILEVEFSSKGGSASGGKNGGIYQFVNVPENAYAELMRATSVGGYFNTQIRDRFQSSKVN